MKDEIHLAIPFRCNKSKAVSTIKKLITEHKTVVLGGLEGAIIVVMDVALQSESEGICKILQVDTSYDLVSCKDTNNFQNRAKISVSLGKVDEIVYSIRA